MINQRQLFFANLAQTSDFPLAIEIEKAEGVYLHGKNGEKYLDLISGIAVSNIGHRHPKVVEAIKNQVDKYLHLMVYGEYIQSPQVVLANKITQTLHPSLDNVYFTSSGSEAIEGAMKLAKRFTGRQQFVAFNRAYHGSTQGALSLGDEQFKRQFRPLLPNIKKIEFDNFDDIKLIDCRTAAVIIEVVAGEAGVRVPQKEYIQAVRKQCDYVGALMIVDEIQTGFGRTGKFWATEHFEIVPDILTIAKGMGGGMPIGAFVSRHEIMAVLKDNPILGHITTFGGHPVSCAASLATIEVLLKSDLIQNAAAKGQLFKDLLVHPKIKEVRGIGLMLAVEFDSFEILKPIIDRVLAKGVITDWFLYCDNSMRIAAPLIITQEEIRNACAVILSCID